MSPATKAYLDMKYTPDSPLGLTWAGTTTVRDAYAWDPATQVPGVRERDILGVEAPLWTETAATRADLDYLVFPRLLGHAEIGVVARRRPDLAALQVASRDARAAPPGARRRVLRVARGALALAAHAGPVIEPSPVLRAAPGHAPQ